MQRSSASASRTGSQPNRGARPAGTATTGRSNVLKPRNTAVAADNGTTNSSGATTKVAAVPLTASGLPRAQTQAQTQTQTQTQEQAQPAAAASSTHSDEQAARRLQLEQWRQDKSRSKTSDSRAFLKPFVVPPRAQPSKPAISVLLQDRSDAAGVPSSAAKARPLSSTPSSASATSASHLKHGSGRAAATQTSAPAKKPLPLLAQASRSMPVRHLPNSTNVGSMPPHPFYEPIASSLDRRKPSMDAIPYSGSGQSSSSSTRRASADAIASIAANAIVARQSLDGQDRAQGASDQNISIALDRLKRMGLFLPGNRDCVFLRVVGPHGDVLTESPVLLPTFYLFSVSHAVAAAKAGKIEVARAMFELIAGAKHNGSRAVKMFTGVDGHGTCQTRILARPPAATAKFWVAWAAFEEAWGNHRAVFEIFDRAEEHISTTSDRELLRTEFHLYGMRTGDRFGQAADEHMRAEQCLEASAAPEPEPHLASLDKPFNGIGSDAAQDDDCGATRVHANPLTAKPILKKNATLVPHAAHNAKPATAQIAETSDKNVSRTLNSNLTGDLATLADILDGLSIAQTPKVKAKNTVSFHGLGPASESKRPLFQTSRAGVSDAAGSGVRGSVTILTPIRAKKKERELFGVDKVVTPVRRSVRNMDESVLPSDDDDAEEESGENQNDRMSRKPATGRSATHGGDFDAVHHNAVSKMLKAYDYAYVPNKALQDEQSIPVTPRRGWLRSRDHRQAVAGATPRAQASSRLAPGTPFRPPNNKTDDDGSDVDMD
ncbi:hypothetical protein BC831DRAFT_465208 [Entophlyctis helioformis]|nr:hypothetical protein BC831DRAFT_465208 [Entophlyctis helioformis]